MVEIDSQTSQVKRMRDDAKAIAPRFLMTPERGRTLDLLQHLLANGKQAILLCGPEGVGKSALLDVLRRHQQDKVTWCPIQGQADLTFDDIRERLEPLLQPQASAGRRASKTVLVIDDAGSLAPGLLSRVAQLAEARPDFRVLCAMTHDQWHIKSRSDPAIENCYIVEAKPLLARECRDFLQHVALLSAPARFGKQLTDGVIETVYRESHGVPGKMLDHFPELKRFKEGPDALLVLTLAVVFLVGLAFYVQWFTGHRHIAADTAVSARVPSAKAEAAARKPVAEAPPMQTPKAADAASVGAAIAPPIDNATAPAVAEPPESVPVEPQQALPEEPADMNAASAPPEPLPQANAEDDADAWLESRPARHYVLQLQVADTAEALRDAVQRHAALQQDMRIVRRSAQGRDAYLLLFGDFADARSAKNARKSLPDEFKSASARKFGALRKQFPAVSRPSLNG